VCHIAAAGLSVGPIPGTVHSAVFLTVPAPLLTFEGPFCRRASTVTQQWPRRTYPLNP